MGNNHIKLTQTVHIIRSTLATDNAWNSEVYTVFIETPHQEWRVIPIDHSHELYFSAQSHTGEDSISAIRFFTDHTSLYMLTAKRLFHNSPSEPAIARLELYTLDSKNLYFARINTNTSADSYNTIEDALYKELGIH